MSDDLPPPPALSLDYVLPMVENTLRQKLQSFLTPSETLRLAALQPDANGVVPVNQIETYISQRHHDDIQNYPQQEAFMRGTCEGLRRQDPSAEDMLSGISETYGSFIRVHAGLTREVGMAEGRLSPQRLQEISQSYVDTEGSLQLLSGAATTPEELQRIRSGLGQAVQNVIERFSETVRQDPALLAAARSIAHIEGVETPDAAAVCRASGQDITSRTP